MQELLSNFDEGPLLTIYANKLLIEYFANNLQLLYCLDKLRPMIQNEWSSLFEKVSPCIKSEPNEKQSVESLSVKYPHFCFHKAKRVLPLRILES